MRHLKRTAKLGRTSEHRNAMLANLVCSLIKHKRVTTTLGEGQGRASRRRKDCHARQARHHSRPPPGRRPFAHARHDAATHQGRTPQMAGKGGRRAHSVRGNRARVQGTQRRLHAHHQNGTAPGRRRPARDSGMGGLYARHSGAPETAPAEEAKPAETKPAETKRPKPKPEKK